MELIFNQIKIDQNGVSEIVEPSLFVKRPLQMRVKLLLEKKISFLKDGEEVEHKAALQNYRKWSVIQGALSSNRI